MHLSAQERLFVVAAAWLRLEMHRSRAGHIHFPSPSPTPPPPDGRLQVKTEHTRLSGGPEGNVLSVSSKALLRGKYI